MKTLIIILLLPFMANAQYEYYEEEATDLDNAVNVQIRGGYQFESEDAAQDILIAPSVSFRAHGIGLTPELVIHYDNSQPVEFGLKMSYKWNFVEAGYGRYFAIYSLDKGATDYNTWLNLWFVSLHCNLLRQNWFIEYDYMNGSRITLGVNGLISKLK
jgi:hypothetical protein